MSTTRIQRGFSLTAQCDLDEQTSAISEGHIHGMLYKPCSRRRAAQHASSSVVASQCIQRHPRLNHDYLKGVTRIASPEILGGTIGPCLLDGASSRMVLETISQFGLQRMAFALDLVGGSYAVLPEEFKRRTPSLNGMLQQKDGHGCRQKKPTFVDGSA